MVVAGPSGVGKGTVIREVRRRRPRVGLSVSWTTRPRRPGEVGGRDYRFVDDEAFDAAVARGDFAEWEEYRGARYGTPWSEVGRALEQGQDLLLEIDVRGARSIKAKFREAVTIFLEPPSFEALRERLRGRGTDSEEQIGARLAAAHQEIEGAGDFDYRVRNDVVDEAAAQVVAILDALSAGGNGPPTNKGSP